MRQHIISVLDVSPAKIIIDELVLDPNVPLEQQSEDLTEDLFAAGFSNWCVLAIGWFPEFNPLGEFAVHLNQHPEGWDPFVERRCRSIADLRLIVAEMAEVARNRRERYLIDGRAIGADHVWVNDLVLDPDVSPALQPGIHKAKLFEACMGMYALTVGWSNAGDPSGEFVVALKRIIEERQLATENPYVVDQQYKPESWQPLLERRCRTVPELQSAVAQFTNVVKQKQEDMRIELGYPERPAR
jgi:hypothetical protein